MSYESDWVETGQSESEFHYRRRRQRSQLNALAEGELTVERVISRDSLYRALSKIKRSGGPAAGVDGISCRSISNRDLGPMAAQQADWVRSGGYLSHATRGSKIPKSSGGGKRQLEIPTYCDRAVAAAVAEVLQVRWEPVFLSGSKGFRPHGGSLRMLAALTAVVTGQNMWVIAVDDIRNAFGSLRIADVIAAHRRASLGLHPDLLKLIKVSLQSGDRRRTVGLPQGNPLSPVGLNAVLHFGHDLPMQERYPGQRWFRYVDNVAYPCTSVACGEAILQEAQRLLSGLKLELKGQGTTAGGTSAETGVVDLRAGGAVQLLGFSIRKRGRRLEFDLAQGSWARLRRRLIEAHGALDANQKAREIVFGWVASRGPAFLFRGRHLQQIISTAAAKGFRDVFSLRELEDQWRTGWLRWEELLRRARRVARLGQASFPSS